MSKFSVSQADAYDFLIWANAMYPQVFKEWVALKDIEHSVEIEDEEDDDAPEE